MTTPDRPTRECPRCHFVGACACGDPAWETVMADRDLVPAPPELPEGLEELVRELASESPYGLDARTADSFARNILVRAGVPELVEATEYMERVGTAYMKYHGEQFYGRKMGDFDGINPALERLRAALARFRKGGA